MDTVTGTDATGRTGFVVMSWPSRPDAGFTHAVQQDGTTSLCGATAAARDAGWPEIGQPWPAGPNRCPACAQVMSASRRP